MEQKRILIIKPSALGDVATTLPLLADLRAAVPEGDKVEIDWLVLPSLAALIEGHPNVDEVIYFDRKKLRSWWWKPSAFLAFRRLLKKLRQKKYDLVIDAQGLLRSGFLARVTGAKMRIGFADAREGARWAYTHHVKLPEEGRKMVSVERMRALLGPLRIDVSRPAQFDLPISPDSHKNAQRLTENLTDFTAVIPGARWETKRWPAERYAQIVRQLLATGTSVVLLGSPDEKPLCDAIAQNVATSAGGAKDGAILNLAGKTDLATMVALLSRAKLVIGNDSGPLHVATALGKRVVALYGPTSPEFVGPYEQLENVLRHDVPCHPCRRRTCDHHSCMQGLTVELVWEKVKSERSGDKGTGNDTGRGSIQGNLPK